MSSPRIAVLLATHNGRRWLPEQLDSILQQEGVDVEVFALDDVSSDGTLEWLVERAAADKRIHVLPSDGPSGSSAANFYRLVARVPLDGHDFYAFADQDDVWQLDKFARHSRLLADGSHDAVSSSVMSFTSDGRRTLVKKDYPQRAFDYLFESPGPGSTFLMTPRLLALSREVIAQPEPSVTGMDFHDSLVYAIGRARGWGWIIDGQPTVEYRQHDSNVMGANLGWRSGWARFSLMRNRWHRNHALLLTRIALTIADPATAIELETIRELLINTSPRSRWRLAVRAGEFRRRPRDARIVAVLTAIGIW